MHAWTWSDAGTVRQVVTEVPWDTGTAPVDGLGVLREGRMNMWSMVEATEDWELSPEHNC